MELKIIILPEALKAMNPEPVTTMPSAKLFKALDVDDQIFMFSFTK